MRLSMTPCPPVTIRPKSTRRNLFFKNNVTSANSGDYPEERGNQMTLGRQCGLVKPLDWPSHGGLQLRADCGPGHKPPAPSALGLSFPTRGSRDGRAPAQRTRVQCLPHAGQWGLQCQRRGAPYSRGAFNTAPRSPKCSPYTSLCCIGSDGVTGVGLRRRDPGRPAGALSSTEGAESPAATPHSHVAEWGSCWTSRDSPAQSACAVTPSLVTLWPRKPRQRRLCVCVWGGVPSEALGPRILGYMGCGKREAGLPPDKARGVRCPSALGVGFLICQM